jgi:hypothetical protein
LRWRREPAALRSQAGRDGDGSWRKALHFQGFA